MVTAAALLLAAAGCRDEPAPATSPLPSARPDSLAAFLAIHSLEPAAPLPGGAWLATRQSEERLDAVRLALESGEIAALLPGRSRDSRALAALADGAALVELAGVDGTAPEWLLVRSDGATRRLGPPVGERWRLLGLDRDGTPHLASSRQAEASGERWLELRPNGDVREQAGLPAGLELVCLSPDGQLAAALLQTSSATELHLVERSSGQVIALGQAESPATIRPIGFAFDGRQLLLSYEDGGGASRAEWLDVATGERRPEALGANCHPTGLRTGARLAAVLVSCHGRAAMKWLAGTTEQGPELPAPPGTRPVDVWFDRGGAVALYALTGGRWPRDLWRLDAGGEAQPLTYGLTPTIAPRDLAEPEPVELALPAGVWGGELLRPRTPTGARAAVLWLQDDAASPPWFDLSPFGQYLAQRGVAVLRLAPPDVRGSRGEAGATGESTANDLAALGRARRWLVEEVDAQTRPVALVGSGPRASRLATLAAATVDAGLAGAAAIDPDLDFVLARFGAGVPPRVPLLLIHDPSGASEAGDALAAAAAVDPLRLRLLARPRGLAPPGARLGPGGAAALAELLSQLFDDAASPARAPR